MNAFQVYCWLQLDRLLILMASALGFSALFLILNMIHQYADCGGQDKQAIRRNNILGVVWCVVLFLTCLIPSSKTIAAMWILPMVASNQNVEMLSEDGRKIYRMAIERVEDLLKVEEKTEDKP